jgi:hypothetical protein
MKLVCMSMTVLNIWSYSCFLILTNGCGLLGKNGFLNTRHNNFDLMK